MPTQIQVATEYVAFVTTQNSTGDSPSPKLDDTHKLWAEFYAKHFGGQRTVEELALFVGCALGELALILLDNNINPESYARHRAKQMIDELTRLYGDKSDEKGVS